MEVTLKVKNEKLSRECTKLNNQICLFCLRYKMTKVEVSLESGKEENYFNVNIKERK
tara:strand:+ start:352 stop:522 length:171 start_codon:yes stop_codon:yes gene_type:complete